MSALAKIGDVYYFPVTDTERYQKILSTSCKRNPLSIESGFLLYSIRELIFLSTICRLLYVRNGQKILTGQ